MTNRSDENLIFHGRPEVMFKIIVLEDPQCGKIELLKSISDNTFPYEYTSAVGMNITKVQVTVKIDKD